MLLSNALLFVEMDSLGWANNAMDRFILARLEAAGVAPAPAADWRTLIRRVSLDLTGLPPTAEDVETFVSDPSPDAYARLVDRLLDSPHYGENWGRHWLDVVRYADTAGETADYPVPVAWRYRNYVIDAFNQDKPYDQFLREQIAGDILARKGPRERYSECVTATGFLAISRRFGFDSENYHHLTIQDTIDTVGQSVLGLSLGCARCHAHKFDPVPMQDYYALYGIFDSTRYSFPGSEQKQRTRALVPLIPPDESGSRWRDYEIRVAALVGTLERQKQSAPSAVLRSLDDLDGDFELQAPAAGGSKGVLVPPWVYDGPIAVTTDAQSPFRNAHPLGRVGASVSDGVQGYRIAQALHPARHRGDAPIHVNLDFRVFTNSPGNSGRHRFWLGSSQGSPAVELLLGMDSVVLRTGDRVEILRSLQAGKWHNVQLDLDPGSGVVRGRVGVPGDVMEFPARPMNPGWDGTLDYVGVDAAHAGHTARAHDEVVDTVVAGVVQQRVRGIAVFEHVYGHAMLVEPERPDPVAKRDQALDVAVAACGVEVAVQTDARGLHHRHAGQPRMREGRDDALHVAAQRGAEGGVLVLEVDRVNVYHGAAPALWDVSLSIGDGELVCVVGPNGAGKTTLIEAIAGLNRVRSGRLVMDGTDLARRLEALCLRLRAPTTP